jgi:decaprenyl-phosphate phosphoribosyltransferase|tara:strand:- start:11374 stop:12333 length:960 start_codon:yes stop_codon:yes gene_type:complete
MKLNLSRNYNSIIPYIKIARPDHWIKNVLIVPGVIVALFFSKNETNFKLLIDLFSSTLALCIASSANYIINEYLDRNTDKFHPIKKDRVSVMGLVSSKGVIISYIIFSSLSLVVAYYVSFSVAIFTFFLLIMGIIYNVHPIRSKDISYLDVLTEGINNPIRFLIGWAAVIPSTIPPTSILFAYWFGGCFLMTVKRLSEFKRYEGSKNLLKYRKSFKYYSLTSLVVVANFYTILFAFFISVFLFKYKLEFILCMPLYAILFSWYLSMGLNKNSSVENPERLHTNYSFVFFSFFVLVATIICAWIKLPWLNLLLKPLIFNF